MTAKFVFKWCRACGRVTEHFAHRLRRTRALGCSKCGLESTERVDSKVPDVFRRRST